MLADTRRAPELVALDASLARLRAMADDLERGSYGGWSVPERPPAEPAGPPAEDGARPALGPAAFFVRAAGRSMVTTGIAALLVVAITAFGDPPRPTLAEDGPGIHEAGQAGQ